VRVPEAAVLAQAADDDGDAGEEEDQPDDDAGHDQRGDEEGRVPRHLPLTPAVWVVPMAVVVAHCRWTRDTKRERERERERERGELEIGHQD